MNERKRSLSAPIIREKDYSGNSLQKRFMEDELLTPWKTAVYKLNLPLSTAHDDKKLPKSFSSSSVAFKKTQSNKYKSCKRTTETDNIKTTYVFQHFKDTNHYIEDYRCEKIKLLQATDELTNDERTFLSENSDPFSFDFPVSQSVKPPTKESLSYKYKLLSNENEFILQKQNKSSPLYSPAKVKSNRLPDAKHTTVSVVTCSLPRFAGVIVPNQSALDKQNFIPEHLLQCRKLNQLSLSPRPSKNFDVSSNTNWRPLPMRKRGNLKVHQTKAMKKNVNSNDYDHVIQHVLSQYDEPQNQVHTPFVTSNGDACSTYLIAPSY